MTVSGLVPLCREFRMPRRGHTLEEYEDACAAVPERGRFAVADGATESSFAALWARLLVDDFVRAADGPPVWAGWLPPLRQRWETAVAAEVGRGWGGAAANGNGAPAAPVPWYLEDRLHQGAFATFLGLTVAGSTWHACAVGDSCLFQVRDGALAHAFPLTHAADFGNAPWLVGSRLVPGEGPRPRDTTASGEARPGDRFWLMTDALAQWFLRCREADGRPWDALESLLLPPDPEAAFASWIEELRTARQLRNDDVTLVGVCL